MRRPSRERLLFMRRRFQFIGAIVFGALVPFLLRGLTIPSAFVSATGVNALAANVIAVIIAFWARLSIQTYPGIRSSYVILPAALAGHGVAVLSFLVTRFPYDLTALVGGFVLHVTWNYAAYIAGERKARRQIAVVPFGAVSDLAGIREVDWKIIKSPSLTDLDGFHALVADFSADLPDEWEAFLADAALDGRIVYQVKQLSESLTGRVELAHLSENSFGSLLPARGYFHLKSFIDFAAALALLPLAIPVMAAVAIAIKLDDGGPVFFRQPRTGHAGRRITVWKFRTMRPAVSGDERDDAITRDNDGRITRVGRVLRKSRLDELPQIFNILKLEMSFIGPRPEAEVLSAWYTSDLPFYRYRHVVKPGISGWAQINQGHVAEVEEVHRKLQYDFYYIKYFSPWLDLLILFRTVRTILTGFGAR